MLKEGIFYSRAQQTFSDETTQLCCCNMKAVADEGREEGREEERKGGRKGGNKRIHIEGQLTHTWGGLRNPFGYNVIHLSPKG